MAQAPEGCTCIRRCCTSGWLGLTSMSLPCSSKVSASEAATRGAARSWTQHPAGSEPLPRQLHLTAAAVTLRRAAYTDADSPKLPVQQGQLTGFVRGEAIRLRSLRCAACRMIAGGRARQLHTSSQTRGPSRLLHQASSGSYSACGTRGLSQEGRLAVCRHVHHKLAAADLTARRRWRLAQQQHH